MTYSEFCEIVRQWIASGEIKTTAELYELDIAIQYAIGQEMQEHGGGVGSHLIRLCALIAVNTHNLSAVLKLRNRGICGAYRGISVIWILLQHIWVIHFYHLRFSKKI